MFNGQIKYFLWPCSIVMLIYQRVPAYFYGIIRSINGVYQYLITGKWMYINGQIYGKGNEWALNGDMFLFFF